MGVALSRIYGEKIPGARPSVQATKASVENLNLLQQGKGEIAFTLGDSLAFAWEGNEEAGFKSKLTKLRGIAAIYPNYIQVVASKESGIKTLADLKGKRLSVGAPSPVRNSTPAPFSRVQGCPTRIWERSSTCRSPSRWTS